MARKRFFAFAVGTAAVAAGVCLLQKKGGVHVTVDVDRPRLGENVSEWKARHAAAAQDTVAGAEESGNEESEA